MKAIGGELALKNINENIYFTDSGRSSLKLFIQNYDKTKKYLIPNFFCNIIEEVLQKFNIEYDFYNILPNLNIDISSISNKQFDVIYIINYFGKILTLDEIDLEGKTVIEDNVFFSNFENRNNYPQWFGFNSFRKISNLADGSMIKTNININYLLINTENAPFCKIKYEAKNIKYDFLNSKSTTLTEEDYLYKFEESENLLDNQKYIYTISNRSISLLYNHNDQKIRKKRFATLLNIFSEYCINKDAIEYSFFVIKIPNRDKFRNKLKNNKIFLPVHWPQSTQANCLYNEIISIPLFETYDNIQFNHMIQILKKELI